MKTGFIINPLAGIGGSVALKGSDMADTVSKEEVAGAQACEDLHVPALFQLWTPCTCDAAGIAAGHRVLDVACGTARFNSPAHIVSASRS